jgi:hypothetical protein
MLIRTYSALLAFQLVMLGALAASPWQQVVQMLTCSGFTLLLWITLDGRLALPVTAGAAGLALAAGSPAAALAAAATGLILFLLKGKPPCAESSAP